MTRHNLPCSISGRLGPHSGHRTWSGSTNTDSRSHPQIWSCGRCRRSGRRPGERPSLPSPWLAGSPSPCSWTTAAGHLWMKQKYNSFEGSVYIQNRHQKVRDGRVHFILPSCQRMFLCLLLCPDGFDDSKNSSNRYEKRKRMGFMEGATEIQRNEEERQWVEERAGFMAAGLKYSHCIAQLFATNTDTEPNNPENNHEGSWFSINLKPGQAGIITSLETSRISHTHTPNITANIFF